MQPLILRPNKRRRKAQGGVAAGSDFAGVKDQKEDANQGAFGADEGSEDESVVRRSVVTELNVDEELVESEEKQLPELPPIARSEGGSQIGRLVARRRNNNEPLDDEAQFRADVARCADEVDADSYENVPIDKFAHRMLRAMGWQPPNRNNSQPEQQDDIPVPRPRGLGLGMKRDGGNTQPAPPTHDGTKKNIRNKESDEDNASNNDDDADVNGGGVFSNFTTSKPKG